MLSNIKTIKPGEGIPRPGKHVQQRYRRWSEKDSEEVTSELTHKWQKWTIHKDLWREKHLRQKKQEVQKPWVEIKLISREGQLLSN